jgi:hypothetical protein
VAVACETSIYLTSGYLFRPTNPHDHVDAQFSSSVVETSLKTYLHKARLDSGETLHSFRAGCALTLMLSGSQLLDVMPHTACYYLQLANVLKAGALLLGYSICRTPSRFTPTIILCTILSQPFRSHFCPMPNGSHLASFSVDFV